MSEPVVNGFCDDRFDSVRAAFEKNFKLELELGACFALAIDGELVVDLWGGHKDLDRTQPWEENTLAFTASNSKIVCTLCGLMLVDRGLINLDEPIATYWPEFAANGKEAIPVRYIFSHSTGLPGFDELQPFETFCDWVAATSLLAAQAPWWEPGTQSGYHGLSYGFLIGELVRRTTGRTIGTFFQEEVARSIGADFYIGLPESEFHRVAELDKGEPREYEPGSIAERATPTWIVLENLNTPAFMAAEIPAGNGYGNARSLARIGSIMACEGELDGTRFLSPEIVREAGEEQLYTHDLVMGAPVRWGLGLGLSSKEIPIPFKGAMHWGGYGGSSTVMIPEKHAAFSYIPTSFETSVFGDARGNRINAAANASLLEL